MTHTGPRAPKKFARNPDGSYAAPRGLPDTLTKVTDPLLGTTFKLKQKDGGEWAFDVNGKL